MSYDQFRPPAIDIGTMVEYATSPDETQRCLGLISSAGKQQAEILCFFRNGQLGKRKFCLHRDDPRCNEFPEIFKDEGRGVWELSASEKRVRQLDARLAGLERMLETMVDEIAVLKRSREPTATEPPRRIRRSKEPVLTG